MNLSAVKTKNFYAISQIPSSKLIWTSKNYFWTGLKVFKFHLWVSDSSKESFQKLYAVLQTLNP